MNSVHALRKDYTLHSLDIDNVNPDPMIQFNDWFTEALKAEALEPNAMVLSTVDASMQVDSRIVLLKDYSTAGFTFFTNYESAKGQQLLVNNKASLLFFWPELERQIRIQGTVQKTTRLVSESYFHSRPRESQIGAHVSPQSQEIASRKILETKVVELSAAFESKTIPLPDQWGGYLLSPTAIEFWQGRSSRLHDRILFVKDGNSWKISRLAP